MAKFSKQLTVCYRRRVLLALCLQVPKFCVRPMRSLMWERTWGDLHIVAQNCYLDNITGTWRVYFGGF